jgi:hypothetical protein
MFGEFVQNTVAPISIFDIVCEVKRGGKLALDWGIEMQQAHGNLESSTLNSC